MSHANQMNFVARIKDKFPDAFVGKDVLEIGSLDINGSVRQFFESCNYIGCDLGAGKGVDIVSPGHMLDYEDKHFDTTISCECFEHDQYWKETFANMVRMTSNLVIFTCASTGRPEHGTTASSPQDAPFTNDYYKNLTKEDFEQAFNLKEMFSEYEFWYQPSSFDLYFYGVRS